MPEISLTGARRSLLRRLNSQTGDRRVWHRFRRNVSISLLGSGASLAIKLGQTALLTRALSLDDYGRVLIVLNLFVFLESFVGLRVSDVMFRFFQPLREKRDTQSLQGLLLICLGISLASGLLISALVFVSAPALAARVYRHAELAPLFRLYGCTVLLTTLSGIYEPLLRIHNRFSSIVVPQVVGGLTTLAILALYVETNAVYNLKVVVAAYAAGVLVQTAPPAVRALRLLRPVMRGVEVSPAVVRVVRDHPEFVRCLFDSNLSGYLKFAVFPGDIFLLGLFSSPAQVALYGLARQLTAPLALLQTNIQTAITPEVASLVARRKLAQLKRLVVRYMVSAFALSVLLITSAVLLGRTLILWLARPEYVPALPVFHALLIVAGLMLVFLVFRPLALSLDLLKWYNLGLLTSAIIPLLFAATGRLNALSMAYIQVAGAVILRLLFNIPVGMRLHTLTVSSSGGEEPDK